MKSTEFDFFNLAVLLFPKVDMSLAQEDGAGIKGGSTSGPTIGSPNIAISVRVHRDTSTPPHSASTLSMNAITPHSE